MRSRNRRPLPGAAALACAGLAGTAWGQGACCLPDQSCVPAASDPQCAGLGGVFLPGEDCAGAPCGPGACCFDESCNIADAFSCIAAGREFAGAGTTCLQDPCGAGVGACCFGDGSCQDLSPAACGGAGGTWLGAGTSCALGPCVLGACCLPGDCQDVTAFQCQALGGTFVAGDACKGEACQPEECPANTLFGQGRDQPDGFTAGTSEQSAGLSRFENFSGIAGPIEALTWWGLDLDHLGGNTWIECAEPDPTFVIAWRQDAGGVPGAEVCSSTVTATRTPTGIEYLGAELNVYSAVLPEPCVLVNGWVGIQGLGDPECWFLWMSAGFGVSYCQGCSVPQQDTDLALCLVGPTGGVFGACCDDGTGSCRDGVEISDCTAPGLRFAPDLACAQLQPPCGVIVGACCMPDGETCSTQTEAACAGLRGNWLGADTLCDQCPCLTPCPGGGDPEGEPVCADGYVDAFNGGCNEPVPLFSPIAAGQTVCGESGVYNDGGAADFDWYEIAVKRPAQLTWAAEAEFRPRLWILDSTGGCPGFVVLATAEALECEALELSAPVAPGTYWLVIAPAAFTDTALCGARYNATASAAVICPADIDGDGTVGITDLVLLLSTWGPGGGPADLNGDGVVNVADLLELLSSWGPCR